MRMLKTALAFLLLSSPAYLFAQDSHFKIEPQYPKQGEKVTLSFDPAGTELEGESAIDGVVYVSDQKTVAAMEVPMKRSGKFFTGSFEVADTAVALAFNFVAGDKKETNEHKGYLVQVYDEKQQPVEGSDRAMNRFYSSRYIDNYLAGIDRNDELAYQYIEKEYRSYPNNIKENFPPYAWSVLDKKNEGYKELLLAELQKLEGQANLSEMDYAGISTWYTRLKEKEKADAWTAKMKEKFPDGNWKKNEAWQELYQEKDAAKKEALAAAYARNFKLDAREAANAKLQVARAYANEKNWDKFNNAISGVETSMLVSLYNSLAWNWAENNENLAMARKLSKRATDWAKKEIDHPTGEKPVTQTSSQWEQSRRHAYAMYADTYAFLLFKEKDYKGGYAYAKEATDIWKRKQAEYNDRYALFLEQVATPAQVKKELEPLVREGYAGPDTREVVARNYAKLNKSDKGLDAYMAALDSVNLVKVKERLRKEMMSKNAPGFSLVNLEGKEVNLSALKGKVVVVDFWATWCGPCKASFPSMQKLVKKYEADHHVAFVFINTWENVPNRKKLVEDFIAKNKYTFNVLYDKAQAETGNDFAVVKDYEVEGIPTKFVVDGNGQIRFKDVGWNGNEFAFMQELQTMIEMAGSGAGGDGKKGF